MGCARCLAVCPKDAIQCLYDEAPAILNKKIAEYTKAVVDGRPCFHVSLVVDVSPNCDCHAENDVPIVPDVGMFASFDPVALDQACADAVLAQTPAPNSALFDEGCDCSSGDYFHAAHPDTDWAVCLEHAEKIGIGTRASSSSKSDLNETKQDLKSPASFSALRAPAQANRALNCSTTASAPVCATSITKLPLETIRDSFRHISVGAGYQAPPGLVPSPT